MAGSMLERIRARMEQMQQELQPEEGFDRRAYGYADDDAEAGPGEQDATFEESDVGEASPWRRPASGPAPSPPGARATAEAREPRRAAARPAASDPFGLPGRQTRGGREGAVRPSPSPREARASGRTIPGSPRPAPDGTARTADPGARRLRRIRLRIRHPDSLRELFLLREVIDRPVVFRRRPGRPGPGGRPA